MVHASHVIFSTYGFWLPNDPRGSWSEFVGAWELFRFGPALKPDEIVSVAHRPHDRGLRLAAKSALKRPAVRLSGLQARAVGRGFEQYIKSAGLVVWACSILPEHIHLVIERHRLAVESLVIQLKGRATERLIAERLHPFQPDDPSVSPKKCWARGEWKVFLDNDEEISRVVEYVEQNPIKEGKARQEWPFVQPYRPQI